MRQRVHRGRLRSSRYDQRRSAMALQVPRHRFQPWIRPSFRNTSGKTGSACAPQWKAKSSGESSCEDLDFAAANRKPMIGHRAGNRRRALDHIKSIHLRLRCFDSAPIREIARVPDAGCAVMEKIAIERNDHGRLIESIYGIHIAAKGQPRALMCRIVAAGFVRIPFCIRELLEQRLHLRGKGRR